MKCLIKLALAVPSFLVCASLYAHPVDYCNHPDRWASSIAQGKLKNAKIIDDTDFKDIKMQNLATEKIGSDLYKQIFKIVFTHQSGKIITVITQNEASSEECSMSEVDVFVVSDTL